MLIDSHAHLNFKAFSQDWEKVILECQNKDIWLINVGSQYDTSKKAVEIAGKYNQGVFAAVGLHPIHVGDEKFEEEKYWQLIKSNLKVVAIGETGLDFYHGAEQTVNQKELFLKHIKLAAEFNLPLILHSRNSKDGKQSAYIQILKILKEAQKKGLARKGVIHCFGGTKKEAQEFLDLGFYIGFTGIVTFNKKAEGLQSVAKDLPLEKLLIETDCPYLSPEPHRGERNLPQYVEFVARKIAELKKIKYEKIVEQTSKNAINLFKLNNF